jgi:hypothetical protein
MAENWVRHSWTQPICEGCWQIREPGHKVPVRLVKSEREREQCVICGHDTLSGIYIRIDPSTAPHPTRVKH